MANNYMTQPSKRIYLFDVVIILWGCGMLPVWILGFYYSFNEGPLLIQSFVMSMAAILVSLCLIVSPLAKRGAAIAAFSFSIGFTIANLVYNIHLIGELVSGLTISVVCFFIPSILLLLVSFPNYNERIFTRFNSTITSLSWVIGGIALLLLLFLFFGVYGIGFSH